MSFCNVDGFVVKVKIAHTSVRGFCSLLGDGGVSCTDGAAVNDELLSVFRSNKSLLTGSDALLPAWTAKPLNCGGVPLLV